MTNYQIYLLEGIRLKLGGTLECASDAEAIDHFIAMHLRPCPAELWDKGRRIAQLSPDGALAMGDLPARSQSA
ncbi:MAG: hypothetical protein Q7T84_17745 [Phenylobacterium sp.]|uniref:hypothetical protein n=1 Tax=Phenylobacterium sp. TaxID=1871053 RepID=UPI002728379A|nr:hypothetical protein [Phenylobacterium sp.]MDO9433146.1 hypothetical protein [Phenylobacterium sp.]